MLATVCSTVGYIAFTAFGLLGVWIAVDPEKRWSEGRTLYLAMLCSLAILGHSVAFQAKQPSEDAIEFLFVVILSILSFPLFLAIFNAIRIIVLSNRDVIE